jgi:hypothetical protein
VFVPGDEEKIRFLALTPGVNVINLLFFVADDELEHLSLETLSSQVLESEGKARALTPVRVPFRCFLLG